MMNFGILPSIGLPELGVILVLVLVVFGAGKLPGVGRGLGQTIKEFKRAMGDKDEKQNTDKMS
ncbi:MAG: twin-arginine translocase TatA/TatE family subunit [Bacillota bacterium]